MGTSAPSLVERAREKRDSPEFGRMWRYVTVSGISTVVSISSLYLFYRVLKFPTVNRQPSAFWANVIATAIATVPSYYLNRSWAWGRSGKSHLMKEVVPFWTIAFVSLVLSSIAVHYAAHEAPIIFKNHHTLQTGLILFANLATYGLLWIGKFLLFNRVLFAAHRNGHRPEPALASVDAGYPAVSEFEPTAAGE